QIITNLSSENLTDVQVEFFVSTIGIGATNKNCTIDINNGVSSGWVPLVSLFETGFFGPTQFNFSLSSAFDNRTDIKMRATTSSGANGGACFLDEIKITAIAGEIFTVEVDRFDSTLNNVDDEIYFRYNDSSDIAAYGHGRYEISNPLKLASVQKHENDTIMCDSRTEGTIAFNSTSKDFLGCDGSSWRILN
ncbi:unnamed protein product, partial [marine sediment metagenome]